MVLNLELPCILIFGTLDEIIAPEIKHYKVLFELKLKVSEQALGRMLEKTDFCVQKKITI